MVLPVPESKIRKHFPILIPPQKPTKNDFGNAFWPLESGISAILHFLRFFTNYAFLTVNMGNFQVEFHPTKQNGSKDIRPPMERSGSPLSKITISFKFMKYLSRVLDCQRKSVILQRKKFGSIFKSICTQQKISDDQKEKISLFLHTISQTKNNSHKHESHFFFFQPYLVYIRKNGPFFLGKSANLLACNS